VIADPKRLPACLPIIVIQSKQKKGRQDGNIDERVKFNDLTDQKIACSGPSSWESDRSIADVCMGFGYVTFSTANDMKSGETMLFPVFAYARS
jgi:hypothetical protein